MGMNLDTAYAILNEAKEGDFFKGDIPERKGEVLNEALYYAEEAKLAFSAGWGKGNDHIAAIVALAALTEEQAVPNNHSIQSETFTEPPESENELSASGHLGREPSKNGGGGIAGTAPTSSLNKLVQDHHLVTPMVLDSPFVDMPRDLTEINDIHIRKLYSEYGALLNHARWLLATATADMNSATHLREDAFRKAYTALEKVDSETGKPKTVNQLELEAKTNPTYVRYNEDVITYTNKTIAWKALVDIYDSNVSRLSRDMTFRQLDWEKGR